MCPRSSRFVPRSCPTLAAGASHAVAASRHLKGAALLVAMLLLRHDATLHRPRHCCDLLCSAPFSAPSWGLLGCGRLPRLGCVDSVVSCATVSSLLTLPCPFSGAFRRGATFFVCLLLLPLPRLSLCTSPRLELDLTPTFVDGRPAPWTGTDASAFLRLAEAPRPPRLECRMEPAVRVAAATLAPHHPSLRQDFPPVLSPGAPRSL